MMVEPYNHATHYERLCKWLAAKGIAKPNPALLSDLGFCVDEKAIGFFYTTNSKACYAENIAADPLVSKDERDFALNTLLRKFDHLALDLKCVVMTIHTDLPSMKERLACNEFSRFGDLTVFYKRVQGGK